MKAGNIHYAVHDGFVVLKLAGQIRYTVMRDSSHLSLALNAFLERLFQSERFENVLIDLTETETIDSTNLGLLAKVAHFTRERLDRRPVILSTRPDINTILDGVGFDQVFLIIHEPCLETKGWQCLESVPESESEMGRLILEAHRSLMNLNEKNKSAFKNVVEILERDFGER